jgi:hypothetical protein
MLDKLLFTSSITRQLSRALIGKESIHLMGFSQGGIIASNVALSLGMRGHQNIINKLTVGSTQISQIRVAVSGAIAGGLRFSNESIRYGSGSHWDFSGFLGPDLRYKYFLGGAVGLTILPVGIKNHEYPF